MIEKQPELLPKDFVLEMGGIEYKKLAVIAPRLTIMWGKKAVLVRYYDTNWFGLPGGKIRDDETDGNLLNIGTLPSLKRELEEECGINIDTLKNEVKFLGLAEINAVCETQRKINYILSPIFIVFLAQKHRDLVVKLEQNPDIHMLSLENPGEVLVLPDARMALNLLIKRQKSPGCFLADRDYYFQMEPCMKLLTHRPTWAKTN